MDKAEPQEFWGSTVVVLCLEGISGGTVPGMACAMIGFHRLSRDGR
jgi:hypothetical protein